MEVRQRWKEHFEEVLKRSNPGQVADVDSNIDMIDEMPSGPLTKAEIQGCRYHSMNAHKAPGVNSITVALLKADITTSVVKLHDIDCEVRASRAVPTDWRKCLIVRLTKCGNWLGITLISVVAEVLGKVLIRRISDGVDAKIEEASLF